MTTHDFTHLHEAATRVCRMIDPCSLYATELGKAAVSAALEALTLSDLAALLAAKAPGWVAVPRECEWTLPEWRTWDDSASYWEKSLADAPKLGEPK